jgi:hypothetical protein
MEPGFAWMVGIAVAFGVAAIIHQWIRFVEETCCLSAMWATVEDVRWDVVV